MTRGLTTAEAKERLKEFGTNKLPEIKPPGFCLIFLQQFLSPLIYILLIAAVVSLAVEEVNDAIFIFIVLLLNAIIGSVQEFSAQKAASALRNMVPAFASVLRGRKIERIEAERIVPGDVILLESGDKVPADICLSQASNLSLDESLLTGESLAVAKQVGDALFAGTMVACGRAQGTVTETGLNTQLGKIAESVTAKAIAKPPLLIRIEKFTLRISLLMLVLIGVLFAVSLLQGGDIKEMLLLAVALAVAAIPEGLPAAITVALAIGMRRMSANNVIIRKLLAVESLGSCTFIASDKTGTLTVNELTARKVILPDEEQFDITGEGTEIDGKILSVEGKENRNDTLEALCLAGMFANEASLQAGGESCGDQVDIAFLVLAEKYGLNRLTLLEQTPEISAIPYESQNAYSASIRNEDGKSIAYVKGSPEKLLTLCDHTPTGVLDAELITQQVKQLAAQGYRVLALAKGEYAEGVPLQNLTFLGLVGMIDPLRSEAREAVTLCKQAGIDVAMITGDHPITALAIAADLGLCDVQCHAITGDDIAQAASQGEAALDAAVKGNHVFARIAPAQKQQIVESLIRLGHFVAVTGDGVNDAPALKHSHVGVAMGRRGTDVARESADLIITDDDFASIVKGVQEGRVVYSNIRKVILMLISTGMAEIVLFILSMLVGLPIPLLATQLLWLNLVTNGVQDVAMAFEPAEGDEMQRLPRHPNEPIFNRQMVMHVVTCGLYMGVVAFGLFYSLLEMGCSVESSRNLTLLLMVLFENMQAFNARSETRSIFSIPFFSNPFLVGSILAAHFIHIAAIYIPGLNSVLQLQPVTLSEWGLCFALAASLLLVEVVYQRVQSMPYGSKLSRDTHSQVVSS